MLISTNVMKSVLSLLILNASICDSYTTVTQNKAWRKPSLRMSTDSSFNSLKSLFSTKSSTTNAVSEHPSVREHISQLNRLHPNLIGQPLQGDELPMHPDVKSGVLENGFSYVILPNQSPPGRFEAHLQVYSGSGMYS